MSKLLKMIKDPRCLLRRMLAAGNFEWMEDKAYLKLMYYAHFGKKLDLENPKTFNEKLQWLKLYDRKPEYSRMVDKYEAKHYVAEKLGEEYIIPTLGLWDRFDDIDFDTLPDQFVLKCTHDSGGLVIVKDKEKLDKAAAKKTIEKSLETNYFYSGREWPYKDVKPRIIAEVFQGEDLKDYKLFCFGGKPEITLVCSERFTETGLCEDFFDGDWNHLPLRRPNHGNNAGSIGKPAAFVQMKMFAEKLSRDIPFLRVDFYEIDGHLYFGEMTFYPASGMEGFTPSAWDLKLGDMITLPGKAK